MVPLTRREPQDERSQDVAPPRLKLFQYDELENKTSIRLIHLSPDLKNGCLSCSIRDADLGQMTPVQEYYALSYYWGDDITPSEMIYINARPFFVAKELWGFLKQMQMDKKTGVHWWIDALCINQANLQERKHQIGLMRRIYISCGKVVAWLGVHPDAMRFINAWVTNDWDNYRPVDEPFVLELLKIAYWRRVWIVQEIALARTVVIACGSFEVDFDNFLTSVQNFFNSELFPESMWQTTVWTLNRLRAHKGKFPLWKLLTEFVHCETREDKDKVYGLLGLVDDGDHEISIVDRLEVNYEKNIEDVFWDAVLESSAPWMTLDNLFDLFPKTMGLSEEDYSYASLVRYRSRNTTSQRHLEGAEKILLVLDAMYRIMAGHHSFSVWQNAVSKLLKHDVDYGLHYSGYLRQAALTGLFLSVRSGDLKARWNIYRDMGRSPSVSRPCPWQAIQPSTYYRILGEFEKDHWPRNTSVQFNNSISIQQLIRDTSLENIISTELFLALEIVEARIQFLIHLQQNRDDNMTISFSFNQNTAFTSVNHLNGCSP